MSDFFIQDLEKAIELQMDITNYIKPFIKGSCWDLDHHIELAKLSIYTGTNYASFTVFDNKLFLANKLVRWLQPNMDDSDLRYMTNNDMHRVTKCIKCGLSLSINWHCKSIVVDRLVNTNKNNAGNFVLMAKHWCMPKFHLWELK